MVTAYGLASFASVHTLVSTRYFQGSSVTGPVKASAARTFREVVDALRMCPTLGISHVDFLALDEKSRNDAKQVPFFVAAVFKESSSKRIYGQATHCNLIFLDIDPEKKQVNGKWVETGRYPAAPFVKDPDSLYMALAGLNFAAHLTASSTPDKPRMRIIIDAEKIPLALYPRAVMAIGALLGLPTITKESKVSVQPMFLPVMFADSTDEEHPLIAYCLEGRAFTPEDVGEGLFPEFEQPRVRSSADPSLDALEFLRAQVPEINLATAKEALYAIDADVSRAEWVNCAAALKHQFAPDKENEAFEVWDEWSQTGQKYGGEKEAQTIWDSLRPTPIGRVPITIRSLLWTAAAAGWDDKKVKENCFRYLVNWLDEVGTITELMEQGVKKIMATPLLTAMQEDVLIHMLCSNAKKRFAYTISTTAIRKDLKRIQSEVKAQEKPAEKTKEPNWARGVCYIAAMQQFYRHRTGEKFSPESFNASYSRHLLPTKEMLKDAGIPLNSATLSKPLVTPNDYALNHLKIVTVYDCAYDPSQPTEMFFINDGKRYVNIYSPTYPQVDLAHAQEAGEILQKHLANLIAEPEHRDTILDFMAYMVQFPGRKIRWAPFIQGAEGAGKTYLANVMRKVLGKGHVRTIGDETIKKGWTEWSFGKQLVVLEEVYASGASRHAVMNTLKKLITNDDIPIEQRNRDSREEENRTNYLMFSNHHDALALTPNDRRYFVLKSPLQHKSQVQALGENYFHHIFNTLDKYPGAFRAFLLDWEISPDFSPDGHAPRTRYVSEMVNDSAGEVTAAIRRMMLEGDYPLLQYDIVSAKTIMDALQLTEGVYRVTAQQVASVLREEGFRQIGRHMFSGERHYLWIRGGVEETTALDVAADRIRANKTHLCMELLYE